MQYKVVGLREEMYIGKSVSGTNCDFEYSDQEMIKHTLLLSTRHGYHKVELTLLNVEGECGSGWCAASYGEYEWKIASTFAEKTHTTVDDVYIDLTEGKMETGEDSLVNEVFTFSEVGGCEYYPSGGYTIDMSKFKQVGVKQEARPVHIFIGDSNLCKSHLASLTGKSVFETDTMETCTLPDVITEDIVVIGKRYDISFDKVIDVLFGECKPIVVQFTKKQQRG